MVYRADRAISNRWVTAAGFIGEASRSFLARPSQVAWPALWLCFTVLLVIPTACFLLVAVSPAAFAQGDAWLTIQSFVDALHGPVLRGLLDSLGISVAAALFALFWAACLAWLNQRTTLPGGQLIPPLIWALLLVPSYLTVLGWESLIDHGGLLGQLGIDGAPFHPILFSPLGITWILTTRGVPFSYLAISAGLAGVGREFEDAARVHGAGRWHSIRLVLVILLPALWSAMAIVFAESMSDFGVASTLAAGSNFPVATYSLYLAIDSMPIRFPVAAAVGWFLVLTAALALIAQYRALGSRSFAVLSGRSRPAARQRLSRGAAVASGLLVTGFFVAAVGIPTIGAVGASLLTDFGAHFSLAAVTFTNYHRALASDDMLGPLLLSGRLAAITACLTVFLGVLIGRMLSRRQVSLIGRLFDLLLLGSVALPSIVLGAGYIFAYNLPIFGKLGINLYGTTFLLGMGYLAAALPSTSRLLVGPMAQLQDSLIDAARVHGAGEVTAFLGTVVPLLAPGMLWAWLLTFSGTLLELPISQILYPPGQEPLSVAIIHHLEAYDFAGGSAMTVLAVLATLGVVCLVLVAFRILGVNRWQRRRLS